MVVGAQLFTVREFTKTPEELARTLARVADIGYRVVQVSGTGPFEAGWLAQELRKNGLTCALTHTAPNRIADETDAVAAEHKLFGCQHMGIGSAPGAFAGGLADYEAFRDRFVPVAGRLRQLGIHLGYHNHHFEFARYGGKLILERMAEDFQPEDLTFILDTYWVQFGGCNPAQWVRRLAGRVPCVHFKDMAIVDNKQRMAVVGEGNIDFDEVLSACADAGTQYVLVEQDDCGGEDPFECLRRSFEYLKARGLA